MWTLQNYANMNTLLQMAYVNRHQPNTNEMSKVLIPRMVQLHPKAKVGK